MISRAYEYIDTGQIDKFLSPHPRADPPGWGAGRPRGVGLSAHDLCITRGGSVAMKRSRVWKLMAGLTVLAVVGAGCGDDDDADTSSDDTADEEASGEFEDYCTVARELDEQEDFPSIEQLEELRDTAPDEISEEIETVVDAFAAAGDDFFAAFEEPGVEEAFGVIEPFEVENCGIEHDADEEEEQDPSVTELDPAAARVDVAATDYAFGFTPPAAGRTSFVMANQGQERHVMLLFLAPEGATTQEVLESEGDLAVAQYESDSAAAGEEAVLTADIVPGEWSMICYIPDAEGTPHFDLGMQETFTVG